MHGRDAVVAGLDAYVDVRYRRVNGDPSAVLFDRDSPFAVMVLDLTAEGDRVHGIYSVTNPDKPARIDDSR